MTKQELVDKLVELYTDPQIPVTAAGGIFAFTYGKYVADVYTPTELMAAAHAKDARVKPRYGAELGSALNMYRYFKAHPEHFSALTLASKATSLAPIKTSKDFEAYAQYLAAIRTKPFVLLAGISGTGKSRLVRELARGCCPRYAAGTTNDHPLYDEQKPGNFESIAVRPNWHDSTELLGYVSRISSKDEYQVTDFVKFLCKAWRYEQEGIPFFLCLDEMNLAPVEQYFAEYLSVIESRQHVDGKIVTDPLVRFKNDDILKQVVDEVYADENLSGTDSEKAQLRTNYFGKFKKAGGIPIPSNLVVMGTVNMDETTFSFSRKVLDRAMSFELNEVAMGGGLDKNPDVAFGSIPEGAARQVLVKGYEAYAESAASKEICDKVVAYLTEVNRLLDGTPFKIAYRTRDEAMIYCIERCRGGAAGGVSLPAALDEITSMKILSRIEGDSLRLAARDVFTQPTDTAQKNLLGQLKALILAALKKLDPDATEERYPVCARKLDGMSERLKGGFTGFWQ